MILGIGTDILNIQRIKTILEGDCSSFIKKTFSVREINQAAKRSDPKLYYAARFAGKEAVFKTFGIIGKDVNLAEIEILEMDTGQPCVFFLGKFKNLASQKGIDSVKISLSYDTDYVIAFALAQD